jgi:predicted protein tyrosine phosphatase
MPAPLKILFVCGRNQWRSPTAERIYRNDPRVDVRSAGVSNHARRQVSGGDLDWADLVLVMERKHGARIRAQFPDRALFPRMDSLEIPDEYHAMDEELVALIRAGTEVHIDAALKPNRVPDSTSGNKP